MHIPDGFLSIEVSATAWILSAGGLGASLKLAARKMKDRTVPLMGVMAAFLFIAQMINFPVMAGTSGHLLGGALAVVLLGPFTGAVVVSCVVIFQALLFQDGGLTALGANTFNMALAGSLGGYVVYKAVRIFVKGERGILAGSAVAAWFSVEAAAVLCALELAWSGTAPLGLIVPAMAGVHALIGIGEAVITVLILGLIVKVRPDLIHEKER